MNSILQKIYNLLEKLMLPQDKAMHLIIGMTMFAIVHAAIGSYVALAVIGAAAVLKETLDSYLGKLQTNAGQPVTHDADIGDIAATVFGGILGLICTAMPHWTL